MNSTSQLPTVYLLRHGETEWSASGRHTSVTDVPLTPAGETQARQLAARFRTVTFSQVFTSPRLRARHTCDLAGLGARAEITDEIREWDYGQYEGLTTPEIHRRQPNWNLFNEGAPGGELPPEVYARARSFVLRLRNLSGTIAVFSHGHFLRVLATAWIGLPVGEGKRLGLNTASVSKLAFEHDRSDEPIIALWNQRSGDQAS